MDREAWWATVPGVKKELDLVTKQQEQNGFTAPLLRALAR